MILALVVEKHALRERQQYWIFLGKISRYPNGDNILQLAELIIVIRDIGKC